jgi:hypothetical protein
MRSQQARRRCLTQILTVDLVVGASTEVELQTLEKIVSCVLLCKGMNNDCPECKYEDTTDRESAAAEAVHLAAEPVQKEQLQLGATLLQVPILEGCTQSHILLTVLMPLATCLVTPRLARGCRE